MIPFKALGGVPPSPAGRTCWHQVSLFFSTSFIVKVSKRWSFPLCFLQGIQAVLGDKGVVGATPSWLSLSPLSLTANPVGGRGPGSVLGLKKISVHWRSWQKCCHHGWRMRGSKVSNSLQPLPYLEREKMGHRLEKHKNCEET